MKNLSLNTLIGVTGIGFTLIAVFIDRISESVDLIESLTVESPPWFIPVAAFFVTPLIGIGIHWMMEGIQWFRSVNELSRSIIRQINPSPAQIIALSLAAGWGEEILFRGAFQPVIGIVLTSVLFAGLHTGFQFNLHALRVYFIVVFVLSIGLGVIARELGLVTAMAVHGSWDLLMVFIIRRELTCDPDPERCEPDQDSSGSHEEQCIIHDSADTVSE